MSEVIRSFLAFELPAQIKEVIETVHGQLKRSSLDVKWVRPGNVHLTLVFLGNVARDDIDPLSGEVSKVCSRYKTFDLSLRGMGIFGSLKSPRVLWIGVEGDLERMGFFRDAIAKRLAHYGVKRESRPFRPHLTLGRFRKGTRGGEVLKDLLTRYMEFYSPPVTLQELTLFKSELRPDGAHYTKIRSWPLTGNK